MGLLNRLAPRKNELDARARGASVVGDDPVFHTKALRKFLSGLTSRESPELLDLGPVVGSNVTLWGRGGERRVAVRDPQVHFHPARRLG